jgi:RNA recognition motif-containing protein
MEDALASLRLGDDSVEAVARQVMPSTMLASYNRYGLWDSISGDLFSSASGDSDVHHARQRSADVLNLDGFNFMEEKGNESADGYQESGRSAGMPGPVADVGNGKLAVPQGGMDAMVDAADKVKRTVYVADVHYQVSEQELAKFFGRCGPLVDFRICGDTNTVLRFAFVEFFSVKAAKAALKLTGSMLGESTIRVSPSKTAIIPVKDQFLPRSERERDLVAKTVYVANIHPTVERDVLKQFFQMVCGPVSKIRLLGDAQHDTKIAFVEFASKKSTAAALRCTGAMLGPLAIRVSPSKTPVRTDARRRSGAPESQMHVPPDAATAAAKISSQLRNSLRQGMAAPGTGPSASSGERKLPGDGSRKPRQSKHHQKPHGKPSGPVNMVKARGGDALNGHPGGRLESGASPTIMSLLESILSD